MRLVLGSPDLAVQTPDHPAGQDSLRESLLHEATADAVDLTKRITIPINITSSAEQNTTALQDPFAQATQYAQGWSYFALVLLVATSLIYIYRLWTDKTRRALHKEAALQRAAEVRKQFWTMAPEEQWGGNGPGNSSVNRTPESSVSALPLVSRYQAKLMAEVSPEPVVETDSSLSTPLANKTFARLRHLLYRPSFTLRLAGQLLSFPSYGPILIVAAAMVFVLLYAFVPQPLYYPQIVDGSPPLAIRAGMLAIAMMPWIIALSMKANIISVVTGIGHERLSVLHRWSGYICLILGLVHAVPFYVQPIWNSPAALGNYINKGYFWQTPSYIYGSGLACLVPLVVLCTHSLPFLRARAYEFFVVVHIPLSMVFLGMLFWHTANYLASWGYLWATVAIWASALFARMFFLNWTNVFDRSSLMRGEAATVTILPENAIKVTIPSRVRWRPGQFVYLRMPELSYLDNHPFTIAALCDDSLPSVYGPAYRDMIIVMRPFAGFTRKLLETGLRNGPRHEYKAFIDGPHGGLDRELLAFDTVVFVAGGSGITAVISHLLHLVMKMRNGTAVTKKVHVIWAMKKPEAADWFREELRICRQYAPAGSVNCQYYITRGRRWSPTFPTPEPGSTAPKEEEGNYDPIEHAAFSERVNTSFQGLASKRTSAMVREGAEDDPEKAKALYQESKDSVKPLPQAHMSPILRSSAPPSQRARPNIKLQIPHNTAPIPMTVIIPSPEQASAFKFSFPTNVGTVVSTPPTATEEGRNPFASPSSVTVVGSPPTASSATKPLVPPMFFEAPPKQHDEDHLTGGSRFGHKRRRSKDPPPPIFTTFSPTFPAPSFPPPIPASNATVDAAERGQRMSTFGLPTTATNIKTDVSATQAHARNESSASTNSGWHTQYGRPDIPTVLRGFERDFGSRAAVFVCGPESMRADVQRVVAGMQGRVLRGEGDEVFLRVESYRL